MRTAQLQEAIDLLSQEAAKLPEEDRRAARASLCRLRGLLGLL
jgi:hypothetical protein